MAGRFITDAGRFSTADGRFLDVVVATVDVVVVVVVLSVVEVTEPCLVFPDPDTMADADTSPDAYLPAGVWPTSLCLWND
jgi:hypothetical protein